MTPPPEANVLEAALHSLKHPPDAIHLPTLSRAATRAADDLELVAEETADRSIRKDLLDQVAQARTSITAARRRAKEAALTVDRTQLLEDSLQPSKKDNETDAARLARQINDSLRRTTAIVAEEIGRSRAAGDVVDESTRRLRMTTDQHSTYGESLSSGAQTLKSIRNTEMLANALVIASFAIFFVAAAYVTKRKIENSNVSTFVIRPGVKVASIPLRIASWMVHAVGGFGSKQDTPEVAERKMSSSAQEADEALKAKEGRESLEEAIEKKKNQNHQEIEVTHDDMGSPDETRTCSSEQVCTSTDLEDTKERNKHSADATAASDDHQIA